MADLITTPLTAALLLGALDVEHTEHGLMPYRLPARARAQADQQLLMAAGQPSGVRLAFRTRATVIELDAHRTTMAFRGVPPRPDGRYDLFIDGRATGQAVSTGGTTVIVDSATGEAEIQPGPPATVRFAELPAGEKDVEIWLPHYERVELLSLRTDAGVEPAGAASRPLWLHHGSSISQGSNAASPGTTWAALAAAHGGVDLINLGFSGSAMLDPFVARTMRDLPADLISVKIGINLVNGDVMRLRAFTPAVHGFLDTIRDGHPATPLLVVSPILCPIHEDTPGPGALDLTDGTMRFRATGDPTDVRAGKLTLQVIRSELTRIIEQRATYDPNLFLLDGRELYGEADAAELPLPDRLHPDAATHRLIAERFTAAAFGAGGPFARTP
ncbi:GDSL-type esterase/lipase family protein [Mycobacterium sp. 21AC1]|uniref:SGNH/GDSL hydrolase family protein n=1 Tax=[Mycobacterium] appelbergii TaxID=2939269 RepID=UPI0029393FBA|nr:SGNH/GDSL hydrolase family protein [Mycobacterium sp. 21AC1]MDV3130017.1 GDSL-type esterase/lipase family protein [Mycobacterium sp. 21AC1]